MMSSTVLFCLAYVVISLFAAWRSRANFLSAQRLSAASGSWLVVTATTLGLAILRATGSGDLVTDGARSRFAVAGWYDGRRDWQAVIVATVGLVCLCGAAALIKRSSSFLGELVPAAGLLSVTAIAAVRVVSLHQIDRIFAVEVAGVRFVAWLETAGLLAIVVGLLASSVDQRDSGADETAP